MPVYRCYFLDRANRIQGVEVLDAADDAQAVAMAKRLLAKASAPGFEVWERARPVLQQPAR